MQSMGMEQIASSMERVASVLRRKPQAAVSEDSAATARWEGGLRASVHSDAGPSVATDMPVEIGGEASAVTPGWLLRAGLASCAVTRIAMAAAAEGITLQTLEARATSRSDVRGLLAIPAPDGCPVPAGPLAMGLHVRIGAPGVPAELLRALVASTAGCSPVTCAVEQPLSVALHVDVAA
jgi:organic hydroperoxide reductase OsmC/OhrA